MGDEAAPGVAPATSDQQGAPRPAREAMGTMSCGILRGMTDDLRRVAFAAVLVAIVLAVLLETSLLSIAADAIRSAFASMTDKPVRWDAPPR